MTEYHIRPGSECIYRSDTNGHLERVKYLIEQGYKGTSDAIDRAAEHGYLEVVRYLIQQRHEGTSSAINRAAENGNLEMVQEQHTQLQLEYEQSQNLLNRITNIPSIRNWLKHKP